MNGKAKKSVMSRVATGTIASGLAIGLLGVGAGVASAAPGPQQVDQRYQSQQYNDHHDNGYRNDQPNWQQQQNNRWDQWLPHYQNQDTQHGFWLFGYWIPLF